ncbi:uncharacterized protein BDV17DRAFT_80929 [Aspergillus undulatus]|uniref:uncharacterized protein n=1 Tax=Aspergillus undulatus TaxID=1810928 RepID=UPI003CCD7E07
MLSSFPFSITYTAGHRRDLTINKARQRTCFLFFSHHFLLSYFISLLLPFLSAFFTFTKRTIDSRLIRLVYTLEDTPKRFQAHIPFSTV